MFLFFKRTICAEQTLGELYCALDLQDPYLKMGVAPLPSDMTYILNNFSDSMLFENIHAYKFQSEA
jgi:hypothetical protein